MKKIFFTMCIISQCLSGFASTFLPNQAPTGEDQRINDFFKNRQDSLERELLFYKVKEDYYTAALEDQGNRFALIIASILGVGALLSYAGFKIELRRIKVEMKSYINSIEMAVQEFREKNSEYDFTNQLNLGNIFTVAADSYKIRLDHLTALECYVTAARAYSTAATMQYHKQLEYEYLLASANSNITEANSILLTILSEGTLYHELKEKSPKIIIELEDINHSLNPDLKDSCDQLRINIRNYTK